jgi:transposase
MPKYKRTDKLQDNLFVPLKLSDQILEGTLAHIIQVMVDNKLDLSAFDEKVHNDLTGRPAYNPRVLLKLILFAYSSGIISSRRIQQFAQQNIVAMALTENQVPNFTVIADFIAGMSGEIQGIFTNILLVACELNLLGNTVFALDGCKLPSNAGKEKSGTFGDLNKKRQKLKDKIEVLIEAHKLEDIQKQNVQRQHQKTIEKLERKISRIESFLAANQPRRSPRNKESQSNITDNESAKMKTGHGVIQGYNGQALVDDKHQLIVSAQAFGKGQDHTLLEPMLEATEEAFKELGKGDNFLAGKTVIADTGYFSQDNLEAADKRSIDLYVPDQNFRKRDIRFADKKRHVKGRKGKICREDFVYDKTKDVVVCPQGQELQLSKGLHRQVNKIIYKRYFGKRAVCDVCPRRKDCLRSEKSKYRLYQIPVGGVDRDHIKRMIQKIDTPEGRKMYSRRMGIVEPVFANIRTHKRMDHFTLRSQIKVNIQWTLFCIVHNLSKIARYGDFQGAF